MPTLEDLKYEREYYYGMQRSLRKQKSEIEERIRDYGRLIDFVEKQIRKREGEEDGDTV